MSGAFLLKLQHGERYATAAGLNTTSFSATAGLDDTMSPGDIPKHPITLNVAGKGVCLNDDATKRLKSLAVCGEPTLMVLAFDDGSRFEAKFLITVMDFLGKVNGEDTYHISLESCGIITPQP